VLLSASGPAARPGHGDDAIDLLGVGGFDRGDAGDHFGCNAAHQLGGTLGIGVLITVFAAASQGNPAHALAEGVPTALTASTILVALALTSCSA
jgi:hypothetical protein